MNKLKYIGYFLCIFLIAGCEEDKLDIEKYGSIAGIIVDGESYAPIEGVQIATNPASTSAITNNNGVFEFAKVLEGELAITARKKDYLSSTVSVAVYDGEKTDLTFFLLKDEKDVGWVTVYDPVPGNGAVDQNTDITFKWNVDLQNKSKELVYTVYYYKSNSTTQKIAGENLVDKEVIVSDLDYSTTYYWYVVAKHEGSRIANSPTWSFRTKSES
jgi:hypothetical protein